MDFQNIQKFNENQIFMEGIFFEILIIYKPSHWPWDKQSIKIDQRSTTFRSKDIKIRTSVFVAKTQILCFD